MNQEYPQVYELGLGSLIGDFFQNVKDTVTGVAKAVAPVAPYVLPFVMPGIGGAIGGKLGSFLTSKLGQSVIGAGIGALAGQKPVDIAKNLAIQTAVSGIGGKLFPSATGAQETIATGGSKQPGFLEKYVTGEDSFLRKTFDPTLRGQKPTASALKFDKAMGIEGAYQNYYQTALEAAKEKGGDAVATFLKTAPAPFEDTKLGYQYGPLLAASSLALPFILPKEPEPEYGPTASERYYADPESYMISYVAKGGPITGFAAGSGQMIEHPNGDIKEHPRRIGEIAGKGTGTSDDIPAMLSDGEFVMTAKAVQNAGGGSRKKGAMNMYKLMKNLENGGTLSQQSMGMLGRS